MAGLRVLPWSHQHRQVSGILDLLTASVSILGLTIDYGPYAFMDVFDENHICSKSAWCYAARC
jgi:uncharacterized protein YdiU (UPF0061 family)